MSSMPIIRNCHQGLVIRACLSEKFLSETAYQGKKLFWKKKSGRERFLGTQGESSQIKHENKKEAMKPDGN